VGVGVLVVVGVEAQAIHDRGLRPAEAGAVDDRASRERRGHEHDGE
jgi:hypothetical protein